MQRVALTANAQRSDITGTVRITASDVFAATHIPPMIVQIRDRAPGLTIDVVATNDISDLMRREADIAIRHMRPEEPDLVARLVREATGRLYAAKCTPARVSGWCMIVWQRRLPRLNRVTHHRSPW